MAKWSFFFAVRLQTLYFVLHLLRLQQKFNINSKGYDTKILFCGHDLNLFHR